MGQRCFGRLGIEVEFVGDGFSTYNFLFEEEVIGQFIFIDFDEVDPGFGLTETMAIIKSMGGALG